jgi:hypothetical protein
MAASPFLSLSAFNLKKAFLRRKVATHFPRLRWENEVRLQANKYDEAALASCEVCT